jgi:hypothetical protein
LSLLTLLFIEQNAMAEIVSALTAPH